MAIPGDPLGGIWDMWRTTLAWRHGQSLTFTRLIAAPYGFSYGPITYLLWGKTLLLFSILFGEVFTYNFFIFISFPLAAITMYLLVWHVTRNRFASLVSGLIFAFSPYHLMRSLQHLTLSHIEWLPLYFLGLLKLREKRTLLNAVFAALSLALVFLFDYYYGYFTFLITIPLIVLFIVFERKRPKIQEDTKNGTRLEFTFVAIIFGGISVLIAILPVITNWRQSRTVFSRSINELYIYTARPLEYLTPSIDNPLFGRFVEDFVSSGLHNSNIFEQTLYLGLVPLFLATIALIKLRRLDDKRLRFIIYFGLVGAAAAILFSAPPTARIFGLTVPFPSYLFYAIAPAFRAYSRFGIFVMLFVALMAGIGFHLLTATSGIRLKIFLTCLTILLVTIEFINIPPWHVVPVTGKAVPPVYRWLAKQPGDFIVSEYPWAPSIDYVNSDYLFYQRVHKKRLANGARPGSYPDRVRESLVDPEDPATAPALRRLGVKYIVVHSKKYRDGMIAAEMKRYFGGPYSQINTLRYGNGSSPVPGSGFTLVKKFGDDSVYAVTVLPGKFLSVWRRNMEAQEYFSSSYRRWMANDGILEISNYSQLPERVDIVMDVFSFARPRRLNVSSGRKILASVVVPVKNGSIRLEKVLLKPGMNRINFNSRPQRINDVLHNGEKRAVSVNFGRISIKSVP